MEITEAELNELLNKRVIIVTDKDVHFTGAIAQNAVEEENITGLVSNRITITKIAIQGMENLAFDVMLFGTDTFEDPDLDVDTFQSFQQLDIPTNGVRIGAANQYYLDISGLNIDYEDQDGTLELHVALRCRSAAGKSAGAAGAVKLVFTYIPRV